jgi:hypothetical protein
LLPILITSLLFVVTTACTSIPVEERAQKREDINQAALEWRLAFTGSADESDLPGPYTMSRSVAADFTCRW